VAKTQHTLQITTNAVYFLSNAAAAFASFLFFFLAVSFAFASAIDF
jgi:hypothetical protein